MSEKISMEKLLPVALELYKGIPSITASTRPENEEEKEAMARTVAEQFATFCHHLQQKLAEKDE